MACPYTCRLFAGAIPYASQSFRQLVRTFANRPDAAAYGKSHECAANLVPLFQAVMAEDWEKVEQIQQQMAQLENEADKLKKSVRQHLPKSLFLPVPRSDLLDLLSVQDKIANRARTSPA